MKEINKKGCSWGMAITIVTVFHLGYRPCQSGYHPDMAILSTKSPRVGLFPQKTPQPGSNSNGFDSKVMFQLVPHGQTRVSCCTLLQYPH